MTFDEAATVSLFAVHEERMLALGARRLPIPVLLVPELNGTCIFYQNGTVLIDVEGRGDIIPTLFTCWRYPKMAASISIFAPVSPFVCKKGADVMLPGCSPGFPC